MWKYTMDTSKVWCHEVTLEFSHEQSGSDWLTQNAWCVAQFGTCCARINRGWEFREYDHAVLFMITWS